MKGDADVIRILFEDMVYYICYAFYFVRFMVFGIDDDL
nr:MAG TPA: hypothetical protein [Caudoviricetes sp.]